MTSGSPLAEPPGNRPKNVRTASAAESYLNNASQPSRLPVSGTADQAPSLIVARHLPPQGPATSIPYVASTPFATFWSTVYCQKTKANGRMSPADASSTDASLSPRPYSMSYGWTP